MQTEAIFSLLDDRWPVSALWPGAVAQNRRMLRYRLLVQQIKINCIMCGNLFCCMIFYSMPFDASAFLLMEIPAFVLIYNLNHNMTSIIHGAIIILWFEFPVQGVNSTPKCTLNIYDTLIPGSAHNDLLGKTRT